jgi:predicted lactoylglutathione lyase
MMIQRGHDGIEGNLSLRQFIVRIGFSEKLPPQLSPDLVPQIIWTRENIFVMLCSCKFVDKILPKIF